MYIFINVLDILKEILSILSRHIEITCLKLALIYITWYNGILDF